MNGGVCEKCGRRVAFTYYGLCGYCVHATTTEAQRAQTFLRANEPEAPREVVWTKGEQAHLTFYRKVWAGVPEEQR
jgi:NMD protein affecting ribosome stability and mRNA decay